MPYQQQSPMDRFIGRFLQGLQVYQSFQDLENRQKQTGINQQQQDLAKEQVQSQIEERRRAAAEQEYFFNKAKPYFEDQPARLGPGTTFEPADPNASPTGNLAPPSPIDAFQSGMITPGGPPDLETMAKGLALMKRDPSALAAFARTEVQRPEKLGPEDILVHPKTGGEIARGIGKGPEKVEPPNIQALEVFINTKGRIRSKGVPEGLTVDEAKATINQHRELERQRLNVTLSQSSFGNADKLRREYLTDSKIFTEVRDMFARVQSSAKNPTPAGDLSMIFAYMKMLDPQSVVRESEFRVAETARPLLEKAGLSWDRIQSVWEGKRLTPEQRQDFLNRASEIYQTQVKSQDQTKKEYRRIAAAAGLDPESVIVEKGLEPSAPSKPEAKQGATINLPTGIPAGSRVLGKTKSGGTVYQTPEGKKLVVE